MSAYSLCIVLVLVMWVGTEYGSVVYAQPMGYVDCNATAISVPAPILCWDASRAALCVNSSFALFNVFASDTLNVNSDVYVPAHGSVLMGSDTGLGANASWINGSLTLDAASSLLMTHVTLTIGGNLTLGPNVTLSMDGANETMARIVVLGCLVLGNSSSMLQVQLNASDGNASRTLNLFSVPSGCILGAFGNVSTGWVQSASVGDQSTVPGASACASPSSLAVLVNAFCTESAPPPPPPPPPPAHPVWIEEVVPAPSNAPTNAPIMYTWVLVPAPPYNDSALAPGPPVDAIDMTLIWTIVGVIGGVIVLVIVFIVIAYKVPRVRGFLMPHRDRIAFVASPSFRASTNSMDASVDATQDTVSSTTRSSPKTPRPQYTMPHEPRTYSYSNNDYHHPRARGLSSAQPPNPAVAVAPLPPVRPPPPFGPPGAPVPHLPLLRLPPPPPPRHTVPPFVNPAMNA